VAVFVEETAKHICPFDPPDLFDAFRCRFRRTNWNVEIDAAVRAGGVVVPDLLGQDAFEVAAVLDQDPVQTLGPDSAYPALGVGVSLRRPRRGLEHLDASRGEDRVEPGGELAIAISNEQPEAAPDRQGSSADYEPVPLENRVSGVDLRFCALSVAAQEAG